MSPTLHIKLFNKRTHSFHFFGVMGFVFGTALGVSLAGMLHLNPLVVLGMSVICACTFFLLASGAKWLLKNEVIVYYHHEIAIIIFCTIALYFLGLPVLTYLDIAILGMAVFLGFGRMGCYSVGCCHGRPHAHGVKYGQLHVAAGFTWFYKDVALFPIQVVESAAVFLLAGFSIFLLFSNEPPGTVMVCYTVLYGLIRFILEFFRGDPERPTWKGISEAQLTTLLLVAISLVLGNFGYLPLYSWHLVIFACLLAAACYIISIKNQSFSYRFFTALHVKEVATALRMLAKPSVASSINSKSIGIKIFTTKQGLSISCAHYKMAAQCIRQYTISAQGNINNVLAHKIAKLICQLQNNTDGYQLCNTKNGIYHVLLKQKPPPEKPFAQPPVILKKPALFGKS
ncbi:MAG: prolipoprotein diacylglyceryl transferase [Ferruginibacter sp.]|nr:prolipoprotein diacylglyceryl transferase [Ferruginibacter sp.]